MSSIATRCLPRLLASLRTHTTARTITSFQGLQGLAQPWKVASPEAEEPEEPMNAHLEALSFWYDESEKMNQMRITPPGAVVDVDLESVAREQTVNLLEHLVEEEVLDVRQGWMGKE